MYHYRQCVNQLTRSSGGGSRVFRLRSCVGGIAVTSVAIADADNLVFERVSEDVVRFAYAGIIACRFYVLITALGVTLQQSTGGVVWSIGQH